MSKNKPPIITPRKSNNLNQDNSSLYKVILQPSLSLDNNDSSNKNNKLKQNVIKSSEFLSTPNTMHRPYPPVTPRTLSNNERGNENSIDLTNFNPFLVRSANGTPNSNGSSVNYSQNDTLSCNSASSCDNESILRGILVYEGKSVDVELLKDSIRWKQINKGEHVLTRIVNLRILQYLIYLIQIIDQK